MKTPNPSNPTTVNPTTVRKHTRTLRCLTTTLVIFFCLTLAASAQNLVGLYQFDDTTNLGKDTSGRGNHLTANGAGFSSTTGKYSNGLSLTGNTYFTTASGNAPAGFPLGNSGYTISAWFKTTATGAYGIMGWGGYLSSQAVNALRMGSGPNGGGGNGFTNYWWANDLAYTGAVSDNTFHNVTATFDGTTRKLYLDGTQVASDTPGSGHAVTAANFALGRTYPGFNEFFQGTLDNVAVWDGALSSAQISTSLNNTFPSFTLSASTAQTIYGVAGGASATIPVTVTDSPLTLGQTYTVSSNQSWLTASPVSNATGGSSTVNITANPGSLSAGTYSGTVSIAAPLFQTRTIAVTFSVVGASIPFGTGGTYAVGASPRTVAAGDFNGDLKPDLAVVNQGGNSVSILLGNGSGGFLPTTSFSVGGGPFAIVVGNFNGDSKLDLAVANTAVVGQNSSVSVLIGDGLGGFTQPGGPYSVRANPHAIMTGDFNGDGKADLATLDNYAMSLSVLLGNGSGGFSSFIQNSAVSYPEGGAVGDFDGDGKLDIAFVNNGFGAGRVYLLKGDGSGQFSLSGSLADVGSGTESLSSGDFNNDGKTDLVLPNVETNTVRVLLGNGSGGFTSLGTLAVGAQPHYVAVGDFNGDGNLDVATANQAGSSVTVLLGNGSGALVEAPGSPFATASAPLGLVAADFNGDGRTDLALTNSGANSVTILFGAASTSTALTSSLNPATPGQSVTFTATVSPATATGTVTFLNGATALGTGTVTGGAAMFTTTALSVGTHSITAVYGGDSTNAASTSNTLSQVVKTASTSAVSSSLNPSDPGQSVTFTATVSPSGATGTVTFMDGAATLGTGTLTGGTATFATAALTSGPHSITAVYGGDTTYAGSTSPVLTQTVKLASTIILQPPVSTNNPVGAPITFTTLAPGSGTVTFKEGETVLGSSPVFGLNATFTTSALTVGTHSITAVYSGNATYAGSTSNVVSVNVTSPASISLTSSANPAIYGQSITYTATVTPSDATGTVHLSSGISAQLTNGVATFTVGGLMPGFTTVTAQYFGDSRYSPAGSNSVSQQVQNGTMISLSTFPNPSNAGQTVTFAVALTPGRSGTVVIKDGTTTLATLTAPLSSTFTTAALTVGVHSLTAVYSGDTNNAGATSNATQTVVGTSSTALASSLSPSVFGQSVTFTATVSPAAATGTVTFLDGATTLGTGTVTGGVATFATTALIVGTHSITAVYGGDTTNLSSTSSALSQVVQAITTTTSVASSVNPAAPGQNVTFTATVAPAAATGTVTFLDGTTTLGTGTLTGGTGTFATSGLTVGTHSITAVYGGTSAYLTSTSASLSQVIGSVTVNPAAITFYGTAAGSSSAIPVTVNFPAGSTLSLATSQTWLTAQNAGNGTVNLTANPASLSGGTYSATATFTVTGLPPATANVIFNVAAPASTFSTSTVGADIPLTGAVTGDFNLDGKPDMAVTSQSGRIRVLLGNGNGGFSNASGSPFVSSDNARAVGAGDFNNDGKPDLAVSGFSDIRIYLGGGAGQFTLSGAARIPISSPSRPLVSDYNRDGNLDIVTVDSSNRVVVLLGNGTGAFSQAPGSPFNSPGAGTFGYASGDVNGDGIPDLALTHNTPNTLSVMLGDGAGGFTHASGSPMAAGTRPWGVALGDLNNDGKLDLAVTNYTTGVVKTWTGSGTGTFTAGGTFSTQTNPISILVADLNGDGKADLGVANYASNSVSVLAGDGAGGFASANNHGAGTSTNPWQLVNADFNSDGRMDLATANQTTGNVTVFLGDRSVPVINWTNSSVTYPAPVSAANLNATATFGGNSVAGTFAYTYSPAGSPVTLIAGTQLTAGARTVTATFTPSDQTTYKTATATAVITVNKGTPTITWPAPAAVSFGSALSSTQLNAKASAGGTPVTGTYVYTPAVGTVLSAGVNQPLSVQFTPADTGNYNSATGSTTITVNGSGAVPGSKAALTVTRSAMERSGANILMTVNIANTGGSDAANVVVSTLKIGTTSALTPLPYSVGMVPAGGSVSVTFTVPGTAGASGASSSLTLSGTFTGGTFSSSGRLTLP